MSKIKVNSLEGVGASTPAISIDNTSGTCTANITNKPNRNLIINGAMQVAQRGSSSTSSGYYTVDRFKVQHSGTDEAPTQSQADVASGTTPYSLGFRKCLRITNGNQTSVSTSDYMWIQYFIEAQDIANSGWNYTSASSFITLSFWVKSSVAQDFKGYLKTVDGSTYNYPFATGSLTADTWTKITKTIAGNSNLQFDNNNEKGFEINILPYLTTSYTDNSVTENAWAAFGSGTRAKDTPSDWWSADNATFEITGLQLEVGSVATDFEHRSFQVEKRLCMRYFQKYFNLPAHGYVPNNGSRSYSHGFIFPVPMRTTPVTTLANTGSVAGQYISDGENTVNVSTLNATGHTPEIAELYFNLSGDLTDYRGAYLISISSTSRQTTYSFDAEL